MSIQIHTNDHIHLDGADTGLGVSQESTGTCVYGRDSLPVPMPHQRYALSCDTPASGVPGRAQFEADLRAALSQ